MLTQVDAEVWTKLVKDRESYIKPTKIGDGFCVGFCPTVGTVAIIGCYPTRALFGVTARTMESKSWRGSGMLK